ncbi:hypothetical protein CBR_g89745, partial [Chara braunii]
MAQATAMAATTTVGCMSTSQPLLSGGPGVPDGCPSGTPRVKSSALRLPSPLSAEWGVVRGLGPVTTPQPPLLLTSSRRQCRQRGLSRAGAGYGGGERATWTAQEPSMTAAAAAANAELPEDGKEEGVTTTTTTTTSPSSSNHGYGDGHGAGSLVLMPKPLLNAVAAAAGSFFVAS